MIHDASINHLTTARLLRERCRSRTELTRVLPHVLTGYSVILIVWCILFEAAGFGVLWLVTRAIATDDRQMAEEVAEQECAPTRPAEHEPPESKAA